MSHIFRLFPILLILHFGSVFCEFSKGGSKEKELLASEKDSAAPEALSGGHEKMAPKKRSEELPLSEKKTGHVIVALCDDEHQEIVPVPDHLGNGKDPDKNLY